MLDLGFVATENDTYLFTQIFDKFYIVVLIYVNDILIIGSHSEKVDQLIHQLHLQFSLKDLGILHYFLGIEVIYGNDMMSLDL